MPSRNRRLDTDSYCQNLLFSVARGTRPPTDPCAHNVLHRARRMGADSAAEEVQGLAAAGCVRGPLPLPAIPEKCELLSTGLADDFSHQGVVWDVTGANTQKQGAGVGTCQVPYIFLYGLESAASPKATHSHFVPLFSFSHCLPL